MAAAERWSGAGPAGDEYEVTLFGPGVGECVVLHLGDGAWMVVDSCLLEGEPVALAYLRAIGVSAAQVEGMVVTHWHDDHHRGAAALLEACPNAKIHASAAVRGREFLQLVAFANDHAPIDVEEFHRVLTQLHARSGRRREGASVDWLRAGTRFLNRTVATGAQVEAWALSPSSASITRTLHELGALIPVVKAPNRRLVAPTPNECSLAVLLKLGRRGVLLGADLEEHGDTSRGWSAVVANHENVEGRADVYKVAHHGSPTAHHEALFTALLAPRAVAAATPFRRSGLPSAADITRLGSRVSALHLTSPTSGKRLASRDPTVERILRGVVRNRRAELGEMGSVRFRFREAGEIAVEHFGAAFQAA